jgi:transposase
MVQAVEKTKTSYDLKWERIGEIAQIIKNVDLINRDWHISGKGMDTTVSTLDVLNNLDTIKKLYAKEIAVILRDDESEHTKNLRDALLKFYKQDKVSSEDIYDMVGGHYLVRFGFGDHFAGRFILSHSGRMVVRELLTIPLRE